MNTTATSSAQHVIDLFGGPSNLARSLDIPQSTVASWIESGHIPAQRQGAVLAVAKSKGLPISADDLIDPCIPEKVGNPKYTGAIVSPFSVPPAPMPKQEIASGLFLNEILAKSEKNTVVCMIGVGSAFAKRNDQTSMLIAKNRKTILVDIGTTIPQAMYRNGMDMTDFDYYHFTHAHADHIGGVEELLLKYRFFKGGKKPRVIISRHFEKILWEHTLKGGSEINEAGLLKFSDLIEPMEPSWVKKSPRETFQICVDGIHLTIFRTIHTPGDVDQWEKAFWSTGLIIDGQILFSADTRFDPTIFSDLDLSQIEVIYHDCQLYTPGAVHAPYEELKTLPSSIKKRMFLTHFGDNFDKFTPQDDGFAGFAQPFVPYLFEQR